MKPVEIELNYKNVQSINNKRISKKNIVDKIIKSNIPVENYQRNKNIVDFLSFLDLFKFISIFILKFLNILMLKMYTINDYWCLLKLFI